MGVNETLAHSSHLALAQWLVTAEGSCTAESLIGRGSHVCRLGKTCFKPPGFSSADRWRGVLPQTKGEGEELRALHPRCSHHDSALICVLTPVSFMQHSCLCLSPL